MLRSIVLAPLRGNLAFLQQATTKRLLHVGVISAPFNRGQRKAGVRDGPWAVKDTGLLDQLRDLGADVTNYGSLREGPERQLERGPGGERCHQMVLQYNRMLSTHVTTAVQNTDVVLTLGGDHSIAIGTINGHLEALPNQQVGVIWVDAHADVNNGGTSPSGNMHGMPLAYHLKELQTRVNRLADNWPKPSLTGANLCYIGLRDVDEGEVQVIKDLGIMAFYMEDVRKMGIEAVVAKCLNQLKPSHDRPLHVSFDIDSLDPELAPSTGTPVPGGLTMAEGQTIVNAARMTGCLRALDLVEVNPGLGDHEDVARTAESARKIALAGLMGHLEP